MADRLFGRLDPLGPVRPGRARPRSGSSASTRSRDNIFEPPGQEIGGVIPFETARQNFHYDETNALFIAVRPQPGTDPEAVRDLATVALRRVRNLRPGMPNTFDLITQDQILDVVGKFTTYFFLAMVSLSSVALLVGGIGVMAIMMVSVTDRTREIGLRKALGATRREILWQFLVEAATLTLVGGLLGIALGLGAGELMKAALDSSRACRCGARRWPARVSIGIGLVFGLYPANRAARMDPVEALRHEYGLYLVPHARRHPGHRRPPRRRRAHVRRHPAQGGRRRAPHRDPGSHRRRDRHARQRRAARRGGGARGGDSRGHRATQRRPSRRPSANNDETRARRRRADPRTSRRGS